jgi:hypothetical protein
MSGSNMAFMPTLLVHIRARRSAIDTRVPISIATLEHPDGRLASGSPNRGVVNGGLSQLGCFAGNTSCG